MCTARNAKEETRPRGPIAVVMVASTRSCPGGGGSLNRPPEGGPGLRGSTLLAVRLLQNAEVFSVLTWPSGIIRSAAAAAVVCFQTDKTTFKDSVDPLGEHTKTETAAAKNEDNYLIYEY